MAQKSRSILAMIFNNFIKSVTPRQLTGTLMGKDYLGTEYFEIPANPEIGKRNPSRWFEPRDKENFEQNIPAEWEAWLRGRRQEPPKEEEVLKNLEIMKTKKKNAMELENATLRTTSNPRVLERAQKGMESFPHYEDYERMPGKKLEK